MTLEILSLFPNTGQKYQVTALWQFGAFKNPQEVKMKNQYQVTHRGTVFNGSAAVMSP